MFEFRLTPAAERDLEAIWRYTRQQWGVEQANRYIDVLTEGFAVLASAPKSAPAIDHIRANYRTRVIERHIVYFKIAPYGIAVVRVLHERMDAPRHL
jgi:toxin ParE1/3/4